jgi:hypothetical protein
MIRMMIKITMRKIELKRKKFNLLLYKNSINLRISNKHNKKLQNLMLLKSSSIKKNKSHNYNSQLRQVKRMQ